MAGSVELANAYVNIIPSTKDVAPAVKKALGQIDGTSAGKTIGSRISGAMGATLKAGALGVGTTVGGVLAGSIAKGMGRLTAIDAAEAKLSGLGSSSEEVAGIMDNALAAVKGTAHGLGEAATVSASMVAAGIKPGKELEDTLKTVGDTAAIAGRSMGDVGMIFGSIAARGKLQGDDMLQLMSAGIPVLQLLSDELGVTSQEVSDMVSNGEVDFATFRSAMEKGMGGGALKMGDTFQGAFANMGAAMGRFGATLLEPAFNQAPGVFSAITDTFDQLAEKIKPVVNQFGERLAPHVENFTRNLGPWTEKALNGMGDAAQSLGDTFGPLLPSLLSLGKSLGSITANISVATWQALGATLNALAPIVQTVLVPLLEKVAQFAEQNPGAVQALVTAFLGFKGLKMLAGPVGTVTGILKNLGGTVKFLGGAFKGQSIAGGLTNVLNGAKNASLVIEKLTGAFSGFMSFMGRIPSVIGPVAKAFGTVLRSINPWVAGISLVVGALTWFFTKTEVGQAIWQKFVDVLVTGWQWVSNALGTGWAWLNDNVFQPLMGFITGTLMPIWQSVWGAVSGAFNSFVGAISNAWTTTIQPVLSQIGQIFVNVLGGILAVAITPFVLAWQAMSWGIQTAWTTIIQPVLAWMGERFQWLYTAVILPVVDWIIAKWQMLSTMLGVVWNFIKVNVIDMFIAAMYWLWNNAIMPVIDWIIGKWQWLQAALNAVWTFINTVVIAAFSAAMHWLWNTAILPVINWVVAKWQWLQSVLLGVWNFIKTTVIDPFFNALHWLWNSAVMPVVNFIVSKWDWLKNMMAQAWQWIDANVLNAFRNAMDRFKGFFSSVVDGIRDAWNSLKRALAIPVNFLIETVYNGGIATAWDTIGSFLPLNPKTAKRLAPIGGFATGGAIRGAGTGTSDEIPAWLSNGEHVLTAADVRAAGGHGAVYAIRDALKRNQGFTFDGDRLTLLPEHINNRKGDLLGAAPGLFPAFAKGGEVRPMWEMQLERAHNWAKSRHGRPYVLGGSADGGGGTDCSGFMSGIADVMGGGSGARQWATMAFNGGGNAQHPTGPQGFVAGLKAHTFSIGVTNGGAAGGHTAGTLGATSRVGAVNVESGGWPSQVKYGTGAVGANDPYFTTHYHLPIGPGGAFVVGKGSGGPSPEQMKNFISDKVANAIDKIMGPVKNRLPSGPPEWKEIPRGAYDKGKHALSDGVGKVVEGLGDKLSTVYTAAQEVGEIVRNAGRNAADWAGRSIGLRDTGGTLAHGQVVTNQSGKPEYVLPPDVTKAFMQFLGDMPGVSGHMERAAVAMQEAAEKLDVEGTVRKSAEDYAADQAKGILGIVGLDGLVPMGQKLGKNAWEAYQSSPYDVGVRGQTVVVQIDADEDDERTKMLRRMEQEVAWLKVDAKRKPKAGVLTKGGVM